MNLSTTIPCPPLHRSESGMGFSDDEIRELADRIRVMKKGNTSLLFHRIPDRKQALMLTRSWA